MTTDTLFESLESRRLLAFTVTSLADAGPGTLRQAIADANGAGGADVISFAPGVEGTITLGSALTVSDALTITGPGAAKLSISGNNAVRVLSVSPGVTASLSDLTITGGTSGADGGGVFNQGTLSLTNVTLSNNTAAGGGGAVHSDGPLTLINCTVTGNSAQGWGGGVSSSDQLIVAGSTLQNNTTGGDGGAILANGAGVFSISSSTIGQNTAQSAGGGVYVNGAFDLSASLVFGNTSARGAGIFVGGSGNAPSVVNSTISSNNATDFGGGVFNVSGNFLRVDNSTITENTAATGGGVHSNGVARLRSTILTGNTNGDFTGSTTLDSSSVANLVGSPTGGLVDGVNGNVVAMDPQLGPLADNGGSTRTHALLPESPAIGHGFNAFSLVFDQRGEGFPRISGGAIDIGAFEFRGVPTTGALTSDLTTASRGQSIVLTLAGVTPADSPIARVNFMRDANRDGIADDDEVIGTDTTGDGLYSVAYALAFILSPGDVHFLAVAVAQDGGQSAPAQTVVTVVNEAPTVGQLGVSSQTHEAGLAGFTLSAPFAADSDGSISIVRFYADLNGNGVADAGEQIGADTDATGGYTYELDPGQQLELPAGPVTFLAVATDADGASSPASSVSATMLINLRPGAGRLVSGSTGRAEVPRVATVNVKGHVIAFEFGWNARDLQALTGAPDAIGDSVIWDDPVSGRTYVAAPTAQGLVLFTRVADGSWSSRNLSTEAGSTEHPATGLTQFASISGRIVISGMSAGGRIVSFQEQSRSDDGAIAFVFKDISSDLESQGMQTPRFESLVSYVPTWDAWHLAGIDADGRIQSVWINLNVPGFTKWRVDDLTASTGAPALAGQLAVTLTQWGGINLTGLNTGGNLLTTWWVPEFGGDWRVNNLTEQFGGAPLANGNVSGYTTPWGGLNYVGLGQDGRVTVYWWAPAATDWSVSPLLPDSVSTTDMPTGKLTSATSPAGVLSVFGSEADGSVVRMHWSPDEAAQPWQIENLTATAERR